jgi:hypothetical protein
MYIQPNPVQYIPLTNELANFISVSYDYFIDFISQEIQEMWDRTWDGLIADGDNLYVANNGDELELDLNTGNAYFKLSPTVPAISIRDLKSIFDEFIAFRDND